MRRLRQRQGGLRHVSVGLLILSIAASAGCFRPRSDPYYDPNRKRAEVIDATPTPVRPPAPTPEPKPAGAPGRIYAVLIGISEYADPAITRLPFARKDAEDLADLLATQPRVTPDQVRLLTDQNATKRNIEDALEGFLGRAGPEDTILLYWSGHGYPDPEVPQNVYFACYDTDLQRPYSGYRMEHVRRSLEEKPARNAIVLADTCHAGKLITRAADGLNERAIGIAPAVAEMARRPETIPRGMALLVAAATDRKAVEDSRWSNGAFTHVLLRGLAGEADGFLGAGRKDGIITLGELRSYMASRLPEETLAVLGKAIHPQIAVTTGDEAINNLPLVRMPSR